MNLAPKLSNDKQYILFVINTEFVLMVSCLYYELIVQQKYTPVWCILRTPNRFKGIDIEKLPGEKRIFNDEIETTKWSPDLSFLPWLSNRTYAEICIQNSYKVASQIVLQRFSKKTTKITFISDSIGLYTQLTPKMVRSFNRKLLYRKYRHGFTKLPVKIIPAKESIKQMNLYISSHILEDVATPFISFNELFNATTNSELCEHLFFLHEDTIAKNWFFTQPIRQHTVFSTEMKACYWEILHQFAKNAQELKIQSVIKVHPGEQLKDYEEFSNPFCRIYPSSNTPAELLFFKMEGKNIFSCFSSISTLDFSGNNNHFWLHPLIGYSPKYAVEFKTIQLLHSFDEFYVLMAEK